MSGHEAVDSYFMADSRRATCIGPGWRDAPRAKHRQTGLVRICLTATAMTVLYWSGPRCLGKAPQRADGSAGGGDLSAPAPHRTSHFFVVSESGSSNWSALSDLLETIHSKLSQAMASQGLALQAGSEPLTWVCFDDREQYRRHSLDVEHASAAFRDAYYSTRTNQVVLCSDGTLEIRGVAGGLAAPDTSARSAELESQSPGGSYGSQAASCERILVLTHEMTHQLAYNSGLQKRGVMYPLWVSEGLATFFEGCALPGADGASNASRKRRLEKLWATGRLLPLQELSVLAGPLALDPSPADVYAQCWGFLGFLLKHHPEELSAYLAHLAQSPMGWRSSASLRHDFIQSFGSIDALERDWQEHVSSLSSQIDGADQAVAAASGL
jgi:hypothetical protein